MLLPQYGSEMDPLFSYFSVYLGLGIGMILIILCCYHNMVLGWTLYFLILSVYLGLGIGIILIILCWCYNMVLGWTLYYLIILLIYILVLV